MNLLITRSKSIPVRLSPNSNTPRKFLAYESHHGEARFQETSFSDSSILQLRPKLGQTYWQDFVKEQHDSIGWHKSTNVGASMHAPDNQNRPQGARYHPTTTFLYLSFRQRNCECVPKIQWSLLLSKIPSKWKILRKNTRRRWPKLSPTSTFNTCGSFWDGARGGLAYPELQHSPVEAEELESCISLLYLSLDDTGK